MPPALDGDHAADSTHLHSVSSERTEGEEVAPEVSIIPEMEVVTEEETKETGISEEEQEDPVDGENNVACLCACRV